MSADAQSNGAVTPAIANAVAIAVSAWSFRRRTQSSIMLEVTSTAGKALPTKLVVPERLLQLASELFMS